MKGYHLTTLTINRSYPEWLPAPFKSGSTADQYCIKLNDYYKNKLEFFDQILFDQKIEVLRIPEFSNNFSDLEGLKKMIEYY